MAELTGAADEGQNQGAANAPAGTRAVRRGWPTRGAVLFWIVASGAVWVALAASAIWIY